MPSASPSCMQCLGLEAPAVETCILAVLVCSASVPDAPTPGPRQTMALPVLYSDDETAKGVLPWAPTPKFWAYAPSDAPCAQPYRPGLPSCFSLIKDRALKKFTFLFHKSTVLPIKDGARTTTSGHEPHVQELACWCKLPGAAIFSCLCSGRWWVRRCLRCAPCLEFY